MTEQHPFVTYRACLTAWRRWQQADGDLDGFAAIVAQLDDAVTRVDGRGIVATALIDLPAASEAVSARVVAKVEATNVSGSHKSRHLFGVMLDLLVQERIGARTERAPLAIASCGNAALAAAVVAKAVDWPIKVFVPEDAPSSTMERLASLDAEIVVAARNPAEMGDPTVLRFREAVAGGAIPFSCQGTDQPVTFDGGAVLGNEIVADLARLAVDVDHVFVQVGGGALMTGIWRGMAAACRARNRRLPRFHAIQTLGGYPLVRAWRIAIDDVISRVESGASGAVEHRIAVELASGPAASAARASVYQRMRDEPECYMWAWHNQPRSIASGILDDETYDFVGCVEAMIETGGTALAVTEDAIRMSRGYTEGVADVQVCFTGVAGLAGVLGAHDVGILRPGDCALVVLSGTQR